MERLLKVPEVAERLGCSTSFVYNAIADGSLRHYRLGKGQGGIRVSEEHLEEYLQSVERGGQAESPAPLPRPRKQLKLRHLEL